MNRISCFQTVLNNNLNTEIVTNSTQSNKRSDESVYNKHLYSEFILKCAKKYDELLFYKFNKFASLEKNDNQIAHVITSQMKKMIYIIEKTQTMICL